MSTENKTTIQEYKETIIGLVLVIIMILSNPNESEHRKKIIDDNSEVTNIPILDNTIGRIGSSLGLTLSGFEVKNYYLFSLGYDNLQDTYLSVGVFGFVIEI